MNVLCFLYDKESFCIADFAVPRRPDGALSVRCRQWRPITITIQVSDHIIGHAISTPVIHKCDLSIESSPGTRDEFRTKLSALSTHVTRTEEMLVKRGKSCNESKLYGVIEKQ